MLYVTAEEFSDEKLFGGTTSGVVHIGSVELWMTGALVGILLWSVETLSSLLMVGCPRFDNV